MNQARFPFLAVNVHEDPGGSLFARPYTILERAGSRIAVVGLAYANTPLTTAEKNVEGVKFSHAPDAVGRAVAEARGKAATVVIVLSHAGLAGDRRLASMVHGIDIIVGGHSHNRTGEPLKEGQTLIVSAGAHGSHVGRLDLRLRDGRIAGYQRQLIVVDRDSLPAHPAVAAQLEAAAQPHRATLDEPIGEARARLVRAQTLAGPEPEKRDQLSPIDVLFANILRAHVRADIALLPGVGYGVAIGPGRITAADLRNLIPHGSKIVTVSLTGAQVKDILEQAVHNVYTDRLSEKVGGMIQVSGLRFKYDPARARGERVLDVLIGDSPLDRSRTYKVGTNSLLADGGHNYRTFLAAASRQEGPEQYEVVKEWFGKVGPVTPPSTDAIEKAGGPHTERSFRRTGRSGP